MKIDFPFVGGAYLDKSLNVNCQESVNWYPHYDKRGGVPKALYPTPGLKSWCATGDAQEVRGMKVVVSFLYAVVGEKVFRINSAGKAIELTGTLLTAAGPVFIESNGTYVMITDEVTGYYILNDVVTEIADADFPIPGSLTYQDGYFIVSEKDTENVWISAIDDPTSWSTLEFTAADTIPDDVVCVKSDHKELFALGSESTEPLYNSANVDFPFERRLGAHMSCGIGAVHSAFTLDNTLFFLDNWGNAVRLSGYTPKIISPPAVAWQFSTYEKISDAIGFGYVAEGHAFACWTFPSANRTWVYDVATEDWHRRSSYPNAPSSRWRANCHAFFANKNLVGDFDNGIIYELDSNTFTDNGELFPCIRTCQATNVLDQDVTYHELEIMMQAGVGLNVGQGSDPQAILQWSNDCGYTWGNEHWLPMGKIGEYGRRIREFAMGSGRNRVFKLTITDPVNRVVVGANISASVGIY